MPLEIEPVRSTRPSRNIRLPARYVDDGFLLDKPVPMQHKQRKNAAETQIEDEEEDPAFTMDANPFGLYRVYARQPTHDPQLCEGIESKCDAPTLAVSKYIDDTVLFGPPQSFVDDDSGAPFSSFSASCLMEWNNTVSTTKSGAELNRLAREFLQRPGFDTSDVATFSYERENARLDKYLDCFQESDGWHTGAVEVRLPCSGESFASESDAPVFKVDGIHYRKITSVIKGLPHS
jgi:hypothetical protein